MPWGDGTGPWGLGPMTGRGLGYCAGYPVPGFMNFPGRGFGFGRGFGRGFRARWFWRRFPWVVPRYVPVVSPTPTPVQGNLEYEYSKEDELQDLKAEKEILEKELKAIEQRIKELEKK